MNSNSESKLDEELVGLGYATLSDAFYEEYSALVNKFVAASSSSPKGWEGDDNFRYGHLSEMSNVASIKDDQPFDPLDIRVFGDELPIDGVSYSSIFQALATKGEKLCVNGKRCFEWRTSVGWYVAGPEKSIDSPKKKAPPSLGM